jgi:hypothetical protein
VQVTNARIAERALKVAEWTGGLQRHAALCVCVAASTTRTRRGARRALEVIPRAELRDASKSLMADLAVRPPAVMGGSTLRSYERAHAARPTNVIIPNNQRDWPRSLPAGMSFGPAS